MLGRDDQASPDGWKSNASLNVSIFHVLTARVWAALKFLTTKFGTKTLPDVLRFWSQNEKSAPSPVWNVLFMDHYSLLLSWIRGLLTNRTQIYLVICTFWMTPNLFWVKKTRTTHSRHWTHNDFLRSQPGGLGRGTRIRDTWLTFPVAHSNKVLCPEVTLFHKTGDRAAKYSTKYIALRPATNNNVRGTKQHTIYPSKWQMSQVCHFNKQPPLSVCERQRNDCFGWLVEVESPFPHFKTKYNDQNALVLWQLTLPFQQQWSLTNTNDSQRTKN